MSAVFRLGLTGGIGSGKSTVAGLLARHGAAVIDADAISRQLTAPQGLAIGPILSAFGADFITPEQALNRERMRALVFGDAGAKDRLESIIHPLVKQVTDDRANAAVANGHRCLVFDVPLLVESGRWRQRLDQILVVDCLVETQITRVMARNALERPVVLAIIAAQATREQRLRAADAVIFNHAKPLDDVAAEVKALTTGYHWCNYFDPPKPA